MTAEVLQEMVDESDRGGDGEVNVMDFLIIINISTIIIRIIIISIIIINIIIINIIINHCYAYYYN